VAIDVAGGDNSWPIASVREGEMPNSHGGFVWYELMTTDTTAAKDFYGKVVGWGAQDASMPDMPYTIFTTGGSQVGGMLPQPDGAKNMGAPPAWLGYVAVDDVDASAAKVKSLGGNVHMPPRDIPDVGRFAVVADPQKAMFTLFKSSKPQQDQGVDFGAPGGVGWHELYTTDREKAFAFYNALFGWQKDQAMDMGEGVGIYQLFSHDGRQVGGMFNKPAEIPATFWLYYFVVGNIDTGIDRVTKGGGNVLMGPMEVPGGKSIIQASDPQGAMFALIGERS
jgi:uncharacterized protein